MSQQTSMNSMRTYHRQGTANFSVGYKLQTRWGPMEAVIFTLECAGAALFAAATLAGEYTTGMVAGVMLVALAIVLLLVHLGHPERAWMAIRNVRTSWISRGTFVLGGFVGLGVLYLVLRHWAGMEETAGIARLVRWILLAASAFILIYPGLILSASPAIPFWNSGLLPVFSAANGAASGLALLLAFAGASGRGPQLASAMPVLEFWLLAILAVVIFIYVAVMLRRGAAAAESAAYLLHGQAALFILGACVVGLALPMFLLLWAVKPGDGAEIAVLVAVFRLAGDLAARAAFLRVGLFNPVV